MYACMHNLGPAYPHRWKKLNWGGGGGGGERRGGEGGGGRGWEGGGRGGEKNCPHQFVCLFVYIVELVNRNGETPEDLAKRLRHLDCISVLNADGGEINYKL